jgi:peptidylprolyl isomerase
MNTSSLKAALGDRITIHFAALLDDGTQIESTKGARPLDFVVGSGTVLPGLDEEVRGMKAGDKRVAVLKPEDAFGPRLEDLIKTVPISSLPEDLDLTPGKRIGARTKEDELIEMDVLAIEGDNVTLDANHPFAGLDITFRIEVISVKKS